MTKQEKIDLIVNSELIDSEEKIELLKRIDWIDEFIKKAAKYLYHSKLYAFLESDLECENIGFSNSINIQAYIRFDTTDWKQAYKLGMEYHQNEFKESDVDWDYSLFKNLTERIENYTYYTYDHVEIGEQPKKIPTLQELI